MNKKRYVIFVLLSAAILLLTSACASESGNTVTAPPPLLEPIAGRMDTAFVARGVVEALTIVPGVTRLPAVAARPEYGSGRVGTIYAWPGSIVYEGQLVARLDTSHIDAVIDNLRQSAELSRTMHRLQAEEMSLQIEMLELAYSNAVAESNNASAEDGEIAAANIRNIRGQIELLRLERNHVIRRHELDITDLEIALSAMRENLEQTEIRAPIAGEVVFTVLPGTWVNTLDPVVYIARADRVFVEYVGMRTIAWHVARIQGVIGGRTYDLTQMTLSLEEQVYYRNRHPDLPARLALPIRFEIQADAQDLPPPGEAVFIRMYSVWLENALRIPSNALFHGGDGVYFVYRIVDGRQEHVYVTVGIVTDFYTEILGGLSEGDEVFVRP